MELTQDQRKQLHEILSNTFSADDLEQMLSLELDRRLDAVTSERSNLRTMAFDVIRASEREGWTRELVEAVGRMRSGRADIQAFAAELLRSEQETAEPPETPFIVPFERNPHFTGRNTVLDTLHARLQPRSDDTPRLEVISGLGGIGKTQTAVEFAYRFRDTYSAVFWISAATVSQIRDGLAVLAAALGLPGAQAKEKDTATEAMQRWLEQHDGWLLVFDNADSPDLLVPYIPRHVGGCILVTSRAQRFQRLQGTVDLIRPDVFAPEEALDFVFTRTGRDRAVQSEAEAAEALVEELGRLPLALEQACAYIVDRQVRIADYLAGFRRRRGELLKKQGPIVGAYPASVYTTWTVNMEEVEEHAGAMDLLRASAFLAPEAIPFELFTGATEAWGEALQEALSGSEEDPLVFSEVLRPLTRFSLVRVSPAEQVFGTHRLVQEVVRDDLGEADRRMWSERVVHVLNRAFPLSDYTNWPQLDRLLPHAREAAGWMERMNLKSEEGAGLLNKMGAYFYDRAIYREAEPCYLRALDVRESILAPGHLDVAQSLNNLAGLYRAQGRYDEAEPRYLRALDIRESALGSDPADVATTLNNIALLYYNQGRYDEAEPRYARALAISESVSGPDHADVATTLNNIALLYRAQGRYAEAEPHYTRALSIRESVHGFEHPAVAQLLNNLAGLYRAQGRNAEAEARYLRALSIQESVLGPNHSDTAQSLNNLAGLYRAQGRTDEAEVLYLRALSIRESVLGPEHPYVATTLNNLAGLHRAQGRTDEAEQLFLRAFEILRARLGDEHANTLRVRENLEAVREVKGEKG